MAAGVLASVWRLKRLWGPLAFYMYKLKCFAENFVMHAHIRNTRDAQYREFDRIFCMFD